MTGNTVVLTRFQHILCIIAKSALYVGKTCTF